MRARSREHRLPRGSVLLPLLLLLCACGGAARQAAPGEAALRVLVYNVHAGKDAAGAHNLERVADEVRRSGADLALLQEVDRGTERSGGEDQVAALERLTGFHGAFGRTLDYQGGEYGIAVLSRGPIASHRVVPLPIEPPQARAGGSYEPRGALVALASTGAGAVHLVDTHLDASGDDRYRVQEVARVRALADSLRRAGAVVLIGGDFNAEPGSRVIESMRAGGWRDAWEGCGEGEGLTFPNDRPVKRIDYLFIPPGVACRSAEVLEAGASDHRAVLFVLAVPPGAPAHHPSRSSRRKP